MPPRSASDERSPIPEHASTAHLVILIPMTVSGRRTRAALIPTAGSEAGIVRRGAPRHVVLASAAGDPSGAGGTAGATRTKGRIAAGRRRGPAPCGRNRKRVLRTLQDRAGDTSRRFDAMRTVCGEIPATAERSSIGRYVDLQSAAPGACMWPMSNPVFSPRPVERRLVEALEDSPVVLIQGPRQCGDARASLSWPGRGAAWRRPADGVSQGGRRRAAGHSRVPGEGRCGDS